jgi:hypothetical protein
MMMPYTAIGLGAGAGLGVWLIIDGIRPRPRPESTGGNRLVEAARSRTPVHVAATLAAVALVGLTTGWPVGGLLAGCAVWALPGILAGAEHRRQARLARLQALATWTESLVATLGGAAGLEQTIIATAPSAPQVIRPEVSALAQALRDGARLEAALRAFAVNLADPVGDTVVAALVLAATDGASRLTEPLGLLATAAREEVAAQRRVERSRAKATTDAQLIIATTLVMAAGLVVFNRGFLRPYDTLTGQIVLAGVGVLFAVGFRWLHQLARHQNAPRVLDLTGTDPDAPSSLGVRP